MKKFYFIIFLLLIARSNYSQTPCPETPTVTYAGKIYNTVQIGNQCWLKENLDVGTRINGSLNQTNDSTIEKYCYNDSIANCDKYGGLYQWNEAMQYVTTPGTQGICPTGWHIPIPAEFQTLDTVVNRNGNSLKAVGQGSGNGAGTNTSGFSALLAGYREDNGHIGYLGIWAIFWISAQNDPTSALCTGLNNSDSSDFSIGISPKAYGYSIRCLKDIPTGINDHSNNIIPKSIDLLQNFPNPFNPNTTISYSLPERTKVVLSVYNGLGEKVTELFNGEKAAGTYSVEWNASKFVSGVYFYELKTDKFTLTKKLILMK